MNIERITLKEITSVRIVSILNNVPVFDTFSTKELSQIASYLRLGEIEPGEIFFREGDRVDYMCLVIEGSVDALKTSLGGKDAVISTLRRGHSTGEMALINEYTHSVTLMATGKTLMIMLARDQFDLLLSEHHDLGVKILKGISRLLSLNLQKMSSRLADYMMPLN